jgi:tetratricopeptide (TPR) repeat protein
MKKLIFLLVLLQSFYSFSQQKKIALIIGNSNYADGKLKNPVNDALLMSQTFKELGFDIILDTNIDTRQDFLTTIRNYQKRREQYKIGIVYYAGHGIQIDGKNFMLATKEKYENKFDVFDNGIDLSILMDEYWLPTKNEVNIFILDACRNNPFESKWNSTRSLNNSSGLAPLKATGALIAYSTESGTTASDGIENDINSIYCKSLVKNLQLENTRIDRVFLNVRNEVRNLTNNAQLPAFYNQLEGEDLILKPTQFTDRLEKIDSLIDIEEYDLALNDVNLILSTSPNLLDALLRKARVLYNSEFENYNAQELFKAQELYPENSNVYNYFARYYSTINKPDLALSSINKAIELSPKNDEYQYWKGRILLDDIKDTLNANIAFESSVNINSNYVLSINQLGIIQEEFFKNFKKAKELYTRTIEIDNKNIEAITNRAYLLYNKFDDKKGAIQEFNSRLIDDSLNSTLWKNLGILYEQFDDTLNAEKSYYIGLRHAQNKAEKSELLSNLAYLNSNVLYYELALNLFNEAINYQPNNPDLYQSRAELYYYYFEDQNNALINYTKSIEVARGINEKIETLENRGDFYLELEDYDHALLDYLNSYLLDTTNVSSINKIGIVYDSKEELENAELFYKKGLQFKEDDPVGVSYILRNLTDIATEKNDFILAEKYWDECIKLNPINKFYMLYAEFLKKLPNRKNDVLENYSKAIKSEPENVDFLFERALYYSDINEINKSEDDYKLILKIKPNDGSALNNLGNIYYDRNENSKAIELYNAGIRNNLNDNNLIGLCFSNRALVYSKLNNVNQSISDIDSSLTIDPLNPERYYSAFIFYTENYFDEIKALNAISLANYIDPDNLDYLYARGNFLNYNKKDTIGAMRDYTKMLEIDSNSTNAKLEISEINRKNGDFNSAERVLNELVESNLSDSTDVILAHLNLGNLYTVNNEFNKAIGEYKIVENLFKDWNKNELVNYYLNYSGDTLLALEILNREIKKTQDLDLLIERSALLFSRGELNESIDDLKSILKTENDKQNTLAKIGVIYSKLGEFKKAKKFIEEAIELDTLNADILFYEAKILMNNGNFYEALRLYDEIKTKTPLDPETYYYKAKIYKNLHDTTNALINYSILWGMLKNKANFIVTDEIGDAVNDGIILFEIAQFFEGINETQSACELYRTSYNLLKNDYSLHAKHIKENIENRLNSLCK